MHDEEQVVRQVENDALAEAPYGPDGLVVYLVDGRRHRPQHERAEQANAFQILPHDARFEARYIDRDIGKLGHDASV